MAQVQNKFTPALFCDSGAPANLLRALDSLFPSTQLGSRKKASLRNTAQQTGSASQGDKPVSTQPLPEALQEALLQHEPVQQRAVAGSLTLAVGCSKGSIRTVSPK